LPAPKKLPRLKWEAALTTMLQAALGCGRDLSMFSTQLVPVIYTFCPSSTTIRHARARKRPRRKAGLCASRIVTSVIST